MQTTTQLAACGTIIRAQGIASEAWYNGVRDAEMERLTRIHAEDAERWEKERKALREEIESTTREANRARKSNIDRLSARTRKSRRQLRMDKVKAIPALVIATLLCWGERLRCVQFPALDAVHADLRRARRQRVQRDA